MATSAAQRARQKAEARRARILASADERLDVVAGLQPAGGLPDEDDEDEAAAVAVSPVASPVAGDGATGVEVLASPENAEAAPEPSAQSKGARRMAAMRKRRYKSKAKEAEAGEDASEKEEPTTEEPKPVGDDAEPAIVAEPAVVDTKVEKVVDSPEPAPAAEAAPSLEEETPTAAEDDKDDEKENQPSPSDEKKDDDDSGAPKKYMGVARMRRKILKEQKAQRLKEAADAPELVAEVATMDVTASMVRAGGSPRLGESLTGSMTNKKGKRKWYHALMPPMKVIPRMVTLLLLFVAGLDLGTQPHRAPAPLSGGMGARNLVAGGHDGPRELVRRAVPSLTRPWEHGLGGRAARMMGMAPSAAPTALPAAFSDVGDEACAAAAGEGACLSSDGGGKDKKPSKIKVQLMEDEFDSTRTRPKGVIADQGSEFDDVDDDAATDSVPNIDPLFQVDLDALLRNANLPLPLALAAKFAIGFHRTWVYCLWTWPVHMIQTMTRLPSTLAGGWVANPPWILVVALAMKLVARVLLGDGASYHSDADKAAAGRGADDGGGGAGKDMDVLGKGVEMAKNYVTSMFPRTTWVLGTAMTVMKVDMYVVLCGMLVGLVGPLAREDYASWKGASGAGGGGSLLEGSRPPLGDEL